MQRKHDLEHRSRDPVCFRAAVEHVDTFLRAGELVRYTDSLAVEETLGDVEEQDTTRTEGMAAVHKGC
jgi:hypothetical protein